MPVPEGVSAATGQTKRKASDWIKSGPTKTTTGDYRGAVESLTDVDTARAAMFAAGEAPKGISIDGKRKNTVTPTVGRQAAPRQENTLVIGNEDTEVVALLTYVDGTQQEATAPDLQTLQASVKQLSDQLAAEGQASQIQVRYKFRPKGSSEGFLTEGEKVSPVAPAPQQTPQPEEKDETERVETKDFVAEISRDGGQWIGKITYKNGSGEEKFVAPSKAALTMNMLVGKANATQKIRRMVREQKLGIEVDKTYKFEGITQADYDAMPEAAKQQLIDAAAATASIAFRQENPDYYNTNENWKRIKQFLDGRELPYTFTNLQYAYNSLIEDDLLEVRPKATVAPATAPASGDSTPVAGTTPAPASVSTPPASAPAVQVRKRVSFGIQPGQVSSGDTELTQPEDGNKSKEPSQAELRNMPLNELAKLARKGYKTHKSY